MDEDGLHVHVVSCPVMTDMHYDMAMTAVAITFQAAKLTGMVR